MIPTIKPQPNSDPKLDEVQASIEGTNPNLELKKQSSNELDSML